MVGFLPIIGNIARNTHKKCEKVAVPSKFSGSFQTLAFTEICPKFPLIDLNFINFKPHSIFGKHFWCLEQKPHSRRTIFLLFGGLKKCLKI